jgi:hypothetical protein
MNEYRELDCGDGLVGVWVIDHGVFSLDTEDVAHTVMI